MTFLEYFNKKVVPIRLIDKRDSWFMKTIAFLLTISNALRITSIKDDPSTDRDESFMGGYGTTIWHTVYETPGWTWDKEATPHAVHELCHVLQSSVKMILRFVFSPQWRMFYESECVQAEVLCFPGHRSEAWFERRVRQFIKYGIEESVVRRELTKRLEEIDKGDARESAARVADALVFWKSGCAR